MTRCRIFRCLILGTALAVAALAVACDDPGTGPAPSPTPTPTTAPSPAHTPTGVPIAVEPSRAQTPTSSSSAPMPTATSARGPTPFPTAIDPAPTATAPPSPEPTPFPTAVEPAPTATAPPSPEPTPFPTAVEPAPTATAPPSPEPTLQEKIEGLFSDYLGNAPFSDHLRELSDYQSPTPADLSSLETLAAHARQDFELTKRAVIAAGFLGLDSSEANLSIDAYLKHQQKYDLQDPTGFASVTALILFQNHLNTPGTIKLPDGSEEDRRSHILSSEERIETLIAGADIWSWLALPERDLMTIPDWFAKAYPNDTENEAHRKKVFLGPFSSNVPINGPVNQPRESWAELHRNLDNLDIQPNSTASYLEALANGTSNLDYHFDSEYMNLAVRKLDFIVANKSGFMEELDVRSRAFIDDIGGFTIIARSRKYDKDLFKRVLDLKEISAFRYLGIEDPRYDNKVVPYPSNEDIILFVTGFTFSVNIRQANAPPGEEGLRTYHPELFGFMYTTENGRDPFGDFVAKYNYTVSKGGRQIAMGEPKLGPTDPLRYPFVDPVESEREWIVENSTLTIFKTYGVNFMFNPAAFDEGFNKDPLYKNDPVAQNRGPWIKVFDNRADAP